MNEKSILIVGTGALATLFAARLSEAGYRIDMLGTWKDGLDALRQRGARLVDSNGKERGFNVRVTDDPRECAGAKYALVLVKAWQTERAARQLKECLADDGIALTLQNGYGNREILESFLGSRAALGIVTAGATLIEPGLARVGGDGIISLEQNQFLGPVEEAFKSARFNTRVVDDAKSLVWGKLVINAAINPLTALLQVANGELLARPAAREMMSALANEAASVAHAEGAILPFENARDAAEDVARKTASNYSSMFQDARRGAPTEIDAICGAVTRIGETHGIHTPINYACWKLVKALAGDIHP